ncbi:hypothetical protein FANTH_2312 [Fusarium anthophilum]|uniref:Uncharacterized protein n=1 Tax=Fusarium anthophilum TaxID=48485 RepID=A0A8H4ZUI7_9HYPO|nr:hypothetical protein FANTH_2312 [Fusarium anthophilum]
MLKSLIVAFAFAAMASAASPHQRDQYSDPYPTSIPSGCNPAHPGSCPESTEVALPKPTSIPGGCNPAHPGSCPESTAIPGGCNPAHPGSCPDTTLASLPSSTAIPGGCNPAHPGSCPTPTKPAVVTAGAFRNAVNLAAAVGLVAAVL